MHSYDRIYLPPTCTYTYLNQKENHTTNTYTYLDQKDIHTYDLTYDNFLAGTKTGSSSTTRSNGSRA